ncbi:protein of unknown function [Moritella yayanosii]|uniref:Uncharacterized protein n=1 Tax=Moritella yayanosii TaxID=69539 RepID=A0A330LSI7_9GAMM|nr:protein of unknown function [Moritella yayanosii]
MLKRLHIFVNYVILHIPLYRLVGTYYIFRRCISALFSRPPKP